MWSVITVEAAGKASFVYSFNNSCCHVKFALLICFSTVSPQSFCAEEQGDIRTGLQDLCDVYHPFLGHTTTLETPLPTLSDKCLGSFASHAQRLYRH